MRISDWSSDVCSSDLLTPYKINYGAMLEVPALAEALDILLPRIDFLSIGTNDLTQFLFAADRSHPKLAGRYDWLSPAILRFIRRVVGVARDHKVPVAVCGEMGGRPLEAMALVGLGIRRLSITPAAVGPIKAMIRSLDRGQMMTHMETLLRSEEHTSELQALMRNSYAVFCLKKKNKQYI